VPPGQLNSELLLNFRQARSYKRRRSRLAYELPRLEGTRAGWCSAERRLPNRCATLVENRRLALTTLLSIVAINDAPVISLRWSFKVKSTVAL
jgi:hypothetical protein